MQNFFVDITKYWTFQTRYSVLKANIVRIYNIIVGKTVIITYCTKNVA